MRVVGGTLRGRKLKTFKGSAIRPTTDRVREAVFNIIAPLMPLDRALDLYAGTGAMGIESLSRGAAQAFFVDSNPAAIDIIKKNIESLGLSKRAKVYKSEAKSFIETVTKKGEGFDLVFIDPPYGAGLLMKTLSLVAKKNNGSILRPGGVIVAEASKRNPIDDKAVPEGLELLDSKKYGDSSIYIFKRS